MRPTDLALERQRRDRSRLAQTVRQVMLNASFEQARDLAALLECVKAGHVTVADAQTVLAEVQADQQRAA
jgi:hypothetical protein